MAEALDSATMIWGGLLTADQLKALGVSDKQEEAQNKRPRRKDRQRPPSMASSPASTDMLQILARMALRQEANMMALLQESEFIIHMAPGQASLLPILLKTHQEWKAGSKSQPLRHCMTLRLMESILERLERLYQSQPSGEVFLECIKHNLIDSNRTMPYLRWDQSARKLTPSKEKALPIGEVRTTMQNVVRILQTDHQVVLRFHAMTKLSQEEAPAKTVPFLLTIGNRTHGELWNQLHSISYHSIWQLALCTMRPQTQQRSNLGKQLQKML
jgi:hypothetical protein